MDVAWIPPDNSTGKPSAHRLNLPETTLGSLDCPQRYADCFRCQKSIARVGRLPDMGIVPNLPVSGSSVRFAVNHRPESRMRENRTYGSEGGETGNSTGLSYPYRTKSEAYFFVGA